MLSEAVLERLRATLVSNGNATLAVLFGSAARGTMRPDSDIDIGYLPRDVAMPLADELDLQIAMSRAAAGNVDLVRLDRAGTVLKYQVARDGRLLFEREAWLWSRFAACAAAEYFDFAPALAVAQERFRRRLVAAAGLGPRPS